MAFHKIILVIGRKRCGKTTLTNALLQKRKRALVVDTFDHPAYREFKPVEGLHVGRIKEGKFRTFDTPPIEVLSTVFSTMYDLTVVMEDAVKYLEANVPKNIKTGFIDNRNRGIDIIIMFHALADVPKYLARMYNDMILFKTDEDIYQCKSRFSNFATIEAAHKSVMENESNYARKIISLNE